jgi:streptogramin lyase
VADDGHGDGNPEDGDALVRLDPDGNPTDYPATHPNGLNAMALAPDGSVWFNNEGSYLYSLTDGGAQLSDPLSLAAPDEVSAIAFAANGTPWFTGSTPNTLEGAGCCRAIGNLAGGVSHVTPIGAQTPVTGIEPYSLTLGPDGALWFAFSKTWSGDTNGFDGIGRIDPATGQIQTADLDPYVPDDIAFGSDGALWFIDSGANVVGRVTIDASLFATAAPDPPAAGRPRSCALRPLMRRRSPSRCRRRGPRRWSALARSALDAGWLRPGAARSPRRSPPPWPGGSG